jgi:bd-type cytochrome oxidase subunit I
MRRAALGPRLHFLATLMVAIGTLISAFWILSSNSFLKSANRPERRNQQPQKEEEQRDHRGRRYVIPSPHQTDEVFSTHSQ